jgi:nifR3 family TIM-barrel protein
MKWKIGNVEIDNQVVLAPMAGITNTTFRSICKSMGAGLVVGEMVSDKALIYDSKKTFELLKMDEMERPIAQQIFGSDPKSMGEAAKIVEECMHPDIIDINMGCPVPKVAIRSQAGSALLKDVNKIYDIVKAVVSNSSIPVTVKIRSGWDSVNAKEVALVCEKAGASAIAIHGRTRSQGYSGSVNYDIIREVKNCVKIPVIGNGDIVDIESAKRMFDTGVDAIRIGRGCLGNPWLLRDLVNYFEDSTKPYPVSYKDRIEMCFHHMDYLMEIKSERVAVMEMRSHIAWYIKGLPDCISVKKDIFKASTSLEIREILKKYLNKLMG